MANAISPGTDMTKSRFYSHTDDSRYAGHPRTRTSRFGWEASHPKADCVLEKTARSQGEANRQEIIDFLKLNNRWYSAEDLFQILNINIASVRTHLNNLVNQDIVLSTFFYKHYSDGRPVRRKITHYKHRDHKL